MAERGAVVDAMFDALDTSGDGSVSRAEVVRAVRGSAVLAAMLGVPRDVSERAGTVGALNAAFDAMDTDHDGRISREELHTFVGTARPMKPA
jgi:Ca2+-binding EF-hand superfamily protein